MFNMQNSEYLWNYQKLLCVSDCSEKPAKAKAAGGQEAAVRSEKAPVRDHEPHGLRLRTCSGKRDGEAGTPKKTL